MLYVKQAGDINAISINDIHQAGSADCFLLSSIGEIALYHPEAISRMIRDNGNGTTTVTLYSDSNGQIPDFQTENFKASQQTIATPTGGDGQETWVKVLEAAYAQANGGAGSLNFGSAGIAMQQLTGNRARPAALNTVTTDSLARNIAAGDLVVFVTNAPPGSFGLVSNHDYMLESLQMINGAAYVQLGNPWGSYQPPLILVSQLSMAFAEVDIGHLADAALPPVVTPPVAVPPVAVPPVIVPPVVVPPVIVPPVVAPPVVAPPVVAPPVVVPPVTIGGTNALVLHMSEDAYQGDAQFVVSIDGQQVGGVQTATALRSAGQSQDFIVRGNLSPGTHSVGVTFLNDAWGGTASTDRNLFVDAIDYNGVTVPNVKAALMGNGTANLAVSSTNDTITFNLSEDAYQGDAQAIIRVDGKQLGDVQTITASHALGQSQAITFAIPPSAGPHSASVQFLNDAWGGTAATDRNLFLGSVDLNGVHYADVGVPLYSNGASAFTLPTSTSPPPATAGDSITFNLSEDAYQGDAQAIIRVDGKQLGGVQTITASHALGQSQAMTFMITPGTGPHTASVQFLNDAWGGSASTDRNLFLGSVDFNGTHYAAAAASLYGNGTSMFSIPASGASSMPALTIEHGAPHAFIIPA